MIFERIRQKYPSLTKSQKRLADFIATSYQEAAFMTASRLARHLALNEATVIRFAQRLGYSGYPALIQDIRAVVQEELEAKARLPQMAAKEPFFGMLETEVENLQRVISHISPQTVLQALRAFEEAKQIYVLGQGLSWPLAELFALSLMHIGLSAQSSRSDPASLAVLLNKIEEKTLLVAFSVAAPAVEVANALRYAKQKGADTIAFAWSSTSPCAQVAEIVFICQASESFAAPSVASVAVLLDAFIQQLAMRDETETRARLEDIGRMQEFLRQG